jgi:hypothetical protein
MKKVISLIAVLALVCFTTMVFAADAAKPAAAPAAAAPAVKAEPVKADAAKAAAPKAEVVKGKIESIDTAKNEIVVKGKTIVVKAEEIAKLKKGEMVKVTLAAGTMNADKVDVVKAKKAAKKAVKKEEKKEEKKEVKAEEKPAEKKAE